MRSGTHDECLVMCFHLGQTTVRGVVRHVLAEGPFVPCRGDPNGCDDWNNWQAWTQDTKDDLKQMALASMDALQVRLTSSFVRN